MSEILPLYYERATRVWDTLPPKRAAELVADLRQLAFNAQRIAGEAEG